MLDKKNRITSRQDIQSIIKNSATLHGKLLVVRMRKKELEEQRATVVISKKVSKLAVTRNRLKRQVKAVLRENLADWKDYDILVFIKTGAVTVSYDALRNELKSLLQK